MRNSNDFLGLLAAPQANLITIFSSLTTLGLLVINDYERLNSGMVEVKRMLASLIQKVQGERLRTEC